MNEQLYPCPICGLSLAGYRCRNHGEMHAVAQVPETFTIEPGQDIPKAGALRLVLLPVGDVRTGIAGPWYSEYTHFDPRPFMAAVIQYAVDRADGHAIDAGSGTFSINVRFVLDRVVGETLIRNNDRARFGLILQRVYKVIDAATPEQGRSFGFVLLDMIRANVTDALRRDADGSR